jgi:ribosome-binding protein aMBF1 (putative translation factor)
MKARNDLTDIDSMMDNLYGRVGTPEREAFRREAYAYYLGQVIRSARKSEKMTQEELAGRTGTDKACISKLERGLVEPDTDTFSRITEALGLHEIVKPVFRPE